MRHRFLVVPAVGVLLAAGVWDAPRGVPAEARLVPAGHAGGAVLSVRTEAGWLPFWKKGSPAERWSGPHRGVTGAVRWTPVGAGVEAGALELDAGGPHLRFRVLLARVDPGSVQLELRRVVRLGGLRGAWTVDSLPAAAVFGVNAGQFEGGRPWGWVLRDGLEEQPPGRGPLAMAIAVDTLGRMTLLEDAEVAATRRQGGLHLAFQSYPALLVGDGRVPEPVLRPGLGVDHEHRDVRLALGVLPDGRVLLALTRFQGGGPLLESLPVGPTTPEMAGLMGALGASRAVLLDGGLSAQMRLGPGGPAGETAGWVERGMRRVPLALVALPRVDIPEPSGSGR